MTAPTAGSPPASALQLPEMSVQHSRPRPPSHAPAATSLPSAAGSRLRSDRDRDAIGDHSMAISRRDFGVSVGALAAHGFAFGKAAGKPAIGTYPIEPETRTTLQRT